MTCMLAQLSIVVAAVAAVAGPQGVGTYTLSRTDLSAGGGMYASGGGYELSGTIGQSDAGGSAGGTFEVSGGFWVAIPPGDCNETGSITLLDHEELAACLTGPGASAGTGCICNDTDVDEDVDLLDVAKIQATFSGL